MKHAKTSIHRSCLPPTFFIQWFDSGNLASLEKIQCTNSETASGVAITRERASPNSQHNCMIAVNYMCTIRVWPGEEKKQQVDNQRRRGSGLADVIKSRVAERPLGTASYSRTLDYFPLCMCTKKRIRDSNRSKAPRWCKKVHTCRK